MPIPPAALAIRAHVCWRGAGVMPVASEHQRHTVRSVNMLHPASLQHLMQYDG